MYKTPPKFRNLIKMLLINGKLFISWFDIFYPLGQVVPYTSLYLGVFLYYFFKVLIFAHYPWKKYGLHTATFKLIMIIMIMQSYGQATPSVHATRRNPTGSLHVVSSAWHGSWTSLDQWVFTSGDGTAFEISLNNVRCRHSEICYECAKLDTP